MFLSLATLRKKSYTLFSAILKRKERKDFSGSIDLRFTHICKKTFCSISSACTSDFTNFSSLPNNRELCNLYICSKAYSLPSINSNKIFFSSWGWCKILKSVSYQVTGGEISLICVTYHKTLNKFK